MVETKLLITIRKERIYKILNEHVTQISSYIVYPRRIVICICLPISYELSCAGINITDTNKGTSSLLLTSFNIFSLFFIST